MVNFRVRDLDAIAAQLQAAGIAIEVDAQQYPGHRVGNSNKIRVRIITDHQHLAWIFGEQAACSQSDLRANFYPKVSVQ